MSKEGKERVRKGWYRVLTHGTNQSFGRVMGAVAVGIQEEQKPGAALSSGCASGKMSAPGRP